jgi:hypothetical protein
MGTGLSILPLVVLRLFYQLDRFHTLALECVCLLTWYCTNTVNLGLIHGMCTAEKLLLADTSP